MRDFRKENRREFLRKLVAATSTVGLTTYITALQGCQKDDFFPEIPKRPLGQTGKMVSMYSLGGQATLEQVWMKDEAADIINRAIDLGINYIDTSAYYGLDGTRNSSALRGTSERNIGQVLKTRRDEVFIATKTLSRNYYIALSELESSLKNLQTDTIDLWQMHSITTDDDLEHIFSETGCLRAFEQARDEGLVKYLGITGHQDPAPLKYLIERYPFDTVLMALNPADKYYNSFIENLLPATVDKEMGIIGMKIPAKERIFDNGGIITMKEAMYYTLSLPVSTIIVGIGQVSELEENIRLAGEFEPLSEDEMLAIEEKVEPYYKHIMFYKGLSYWPPN